MTLHVAAFDQLSAATLYGLLRLRMQVFIVEQRCPYQDLDGRDTEPGTRHVWLDDDGSPQAYLRILAEPDGADRIGRVCVAPAARGTGGTGCASGRPPASSDSPNTNTSLACRNWRSLDGRRSMEAAGKLW